MTYHTFDAMTDVAVILVRSDKTRFATWVQSFALSTLAVCACAKTAMRRPIVVMTETQVRGISPGIPTRYTPNLLLVKTRKLIEI